jgi:hypothetical protein
MTAEPKIKNMFTSKFLAVVVMVLFSVSAFAQVSSDSINTLKQQKESLELSTKINDRKLELAKLENAIDKKTADLENAKTDAQKAADDNAAAATGLSSNPQDKKLARKARKAASYAERCAKRVRNAAGDLSDLKSNIESLKNKIADDEVTLSRMPQRQ